MSICISNIKVHIDADVSKYHQKVIDVLFTVSHLLRAGWKVDGERTRRNPILNAVDKSLPDLCRGSGKIFSDCAIRAGTSARTFLFSKRDRADVVIESS